MSLDLDRVRSIVDRVAASSRLEVVEVELRGGGKSRMLRVFIDKPGGVTHEDCANLSREVSTILDVEDAVPGGSYLLEVSSPGLDRKLVRPADYVRFAGSRVRIATRHPVEGSRQFDGKLQRFEDGRVTMELPPPRRARDKARVGGEARVVQIEYSNIEKANLVPEF
jgi:ribosome maturation factor RimP